MEPKMETRPEHQANSDTMCSLCGRKCLAGENFCAQCGARLTLKQPAATLEPVNIGVINAEPIASEAPADKPQAARKRIGPTVAPYGENPAQPKTEISSAAKSIFEADYDLTLTPPANNTPLIKPQPRRANTKPVSPDFIDPFDVPPRMPTPKQRPQAAFAPRRAKPKPAPKAKTRSAREEKWFNFLDDHMRSLIAMLMLILTVGGVSVWATLTPGGQRVMAHIGIGGAAGLALIGDDAMAEGNYSRAAENYMQSLSKETDDIVAFKLARAYAYSGETNDAARALLLCIDLNAYRAEAYDMLKSLYPDAATRPENVKMALDKGAALFSE